MAVSVFPDQLWRVTFRVDADKHDSGQRVLAGIGELAFCQRKDLQCGGANIRTMGEAEEDQVPTT